MKYVVRGRKTHTFFLKIWERNDSKWKFFGEWHGEFGSFSKKEEAEQSKMFKGKNWKGLKKTDQVCPKHAIFANWDKSRASCQDQPLEH